MDDSDFSYDTFLIEIMIGDVPNYVMCGRLDGPRPVESIQGVTREQIEKLFAGGALRAAPLPSPRQSMVRLAIPIQSMDHFGQHPNP